MFLFNKYPVIDYKFDTVGTIPVVDITRRVRINSLLRDRATVLYEYDVKDGDRLDIIADKYYKDTTLDWVILLTNNILDPYFAWPLNTYDFEAYIRKRYGSISTAQATMHHYEWIVSPAKRFTNTDGEEIVIAERTIIVDHATFLTLAADVRRDVDTYEHEIAENERRRRIKILDRAFVPAIKKAMNTVFND